MNNAEKPFWSDDDLSRTNHLQMMLQMHMNAIISTETLLEQFGLNYQKELERIRKENKQE